MARAEHGERGDLGLLIAWLRELQHWTQTDLGREAGLDKSQISNYENGQQPHRQNLDKILTAVHIPRAWAEALLPVIRLYRRIAMGQECSGDELSPASAVKAVTVALESLLPPLLTGVSTPVERSKPSLEEQRLKADERFDRMALRTPREREILVDRSPRFRHWATVERMCEASRKAAAHSPREAEEWANLALRASRSSEGKMSLRRLEAYCLGHWGNARRVANDHDDAQRAFRQTWELWVEGGEEFEDKVLDVAWLLGMEASLRRVQLLFPESLLLLDQALQLARSEKARVALLIAKANALEMLNDYDGALAALRQTRELPDAVDCQLAFQQRYVMVRNLTWLARYSEAEELLPHVRELALKLNNDLELMRVRWWEGQVAAGQGRREEARAILEQVQRDFVARDLAYDAALVSLELAALYLEEDRLTEVRTLAVEMMPIFTSRHIHREALAALRLFCAATERGEVTLQLTKRLVRYLERARHDPELSFQP